MHKKISSLLLVTLLACGAPALAQMTNRDIADRMDRLEHDLMILQRQAARGGSGGGDGENDNAGAGDSSGSADIQISNLQEELRKLRGRIEENEFQMRQVSERQTKLQQDMDFRFGEIGTRLGALEAKSNEAKVSEAKGATPPATPPKPEAAPPQEPAAPEDAGESPATPAPKGDGTFATPRDHYNYASGLLRQSHYEDAQRSFTEFTQKYPKDPLIGNAWYWLGETFYIRHDYVKAADNFRKGFEALPDGPKAADNLLKLSMSLSAMNKTKDACTVLGQLAVKFKTSAPSVAQKAEAERTRLECK